MRVLSVVHHDNAAAGVFAEPAAAAGHELVEWLPAEAEPPDLAEIDAALIFGAAPQVDQEDRHPWLRPEKRFVRALLERGTPTVGVCFGSQLVAEAAGAVVRPAARPEVGWHEIELLPAAAVDPLLGFLPERTEVFSWHSYEWLLPPAATALARSDVGLQAFRLDDRPVWGIQFHPEVTEADVGSWIDDWPNDAAAQSTGIDPEELRRETAAKIATWNDVGRAISERFVAAAEGALSAGR
jgi:GMP synthase (glutamine-hydrolysing)